MKRFAKPALAAGAIALAVSIGVPQQAQAGSRGGQVAAAAIIGLATGAIIAGAVNQSRYYGYYGPGYYPGYANAYYPPYYPSGPVYYSYDAYYPYAGYPAGRYYRRPYVDYRRPYYNYGPYNGIRFQHQINPYYPNW